MTNALPSDLRLDGRYSMSETAKILEVDPSTLWRWVKSGKIRVSGYRRVNGRPFIKGREITRMFNQ